MDIQKVIHQIKKKQIAPVYVFYGEQTYLIEQAMQALLEQVLDEDGLDFNYETFDMQEHPIQDAIEAAETYPFIGEKRLVVAERAHFLTGAKEQTETEHALDRLEKYVANPVDHAVLVLVVPAEKLDERKKIVKALKKTSVVATSMSFSNTNLRNWVQQKANEFQAEINQQASELLIQLVGDDLQLLATELHKMAHAVGVHGRITPQTVDALVSRTLEHDIFKLIDHVVRLEMDRAFTMLHDLIKRKEEPVKMLVLIARQFRIIYRVKLLSAAGIPQKEMASRVGAPPFVCKLASGQGRHYTVQQLEQILDYLAELDFGMKTGKMEKVLALELFLLRLGKRKTAQAQLG